MSTFGLIPARGGSKGVPRKNIKEIAGKPLIVWTIEAALRSTRLDAVVVSTEDAEIAEIARHAGALVPFLRPLALAQDATPGIDPVLHALDALPQFDAVMLLQPTSPMRDTGDIDGCMDFARTRGAVSVVSVCEPDCHPLWTYRLGSDQSLTPLIEGSAVLRRQDLPAVGALNGAMYFADAAWLRKSGRLVGPETLSYMMSREHSVDIDRMFDWKFAELLLKELV